jgi:hypothetical protein
MATRHIQLLQKVEKVVGEFFIDDFIIHTPEPFGPYWLGAGFSGLTFGRCRFWIAGHDLVRAVTHEIVER